MKVLGGPPITMKNSFGCRAKCAQALSIDKRYKIALTLDAATLGRFPVMEIGAVTRDATEMERSLCVHVQVHEKLTSLEVVVEAYSRVSTSTSMSLSKMDVNVIGVSVTGDGLLTPRVLEVPMLLGVGAEFHFFVAARDFEGTVRIDSFEEFELK